MRGFDRATARVRCCLEDRYGADQARPLVAEAREHFIHLIPELPDLGGRQPFTRFVFTAAWSLAFYRALARHGGSPREAGELAYALTADSLESLPRTATRLIEWAWFSPLFRRRLRYRARQSRDRRRTGDFVFEYVEGDGRRFDFGVDYSECAVLTLLESQGAPELAPYLCALDQLSSEALGWGLVRTTTLAEGGARCDFRFKRGRATHLTSTVLPVLDARGPAHGAARPAGVRREGIDDRTASRRW